jgi:hypothetical protein
MRRNHRSLRKQLQAHDSMFNLWQNHGWKSRQMFHLWCHPHSLDSSSISFFDFIIFQFSFSVRFVLLLCNLLMNFCDRNIMFVQVLQTIKITLLEGLWLDCLIFRRRKVLKISGLCKRMDWRVAKLLIPWGYWKFEIALLICICGFIACICSCEIVILDVFVLVCMNKIWKNRRLLILTCTLDLGTRVKKSACMGFL